MNIKEITNRNYAATVKRGQISDKTEFKDFMLKIIEEYEEIYKSYCRSDNSFDKKELADVALVCFTMAKHYDIDLIEVMIEKMLYNEIRKD